MAFSFWWPNLFEEPAWVGLYLPAEEVFAPRNARMNRLCSYRGIEWKHLLGIQSESLETLMGKAGLRYERTQAGG
jgi:hypothetical protein